MKISDMREVLDAIEAAAGDVDLVLVSKDLETTKEMTLGVAEVEGEIVVIVYETGTIVPARLRLV